jgi:hypothetical protein
MILPSVGAACPLQTMRGETCLYRKKSHSDCRKFSRRIISNGKFREKKGKVR